MMTAESMFSKRRVLKINVVLLYFSTLTCFRPHISCIPKLFILSRLNETSGHLSEGPDATHFSDCLAIIQPETR